MQSNEHKETSFFSVILGILSFLFGFFLIYLIVKGLKGKGDCGGNVISSCGGKKNEEKSFLSRDSRTDVCDFNLNERQSEILKTMMRGDRREISPSEIYKLQPDVSTRTLRRDMDVLVGLGVVRQEGSTKSTKYTYVG